MSKTKILYVEWDDSTSGMDGGWHSAEAFKAIPQILCMSIGLVISENKHFIDLAPHWYEGTNGGSLTVSGCMRIPKSAIRRSKVIRK